MPKSTERSDIHVRLTPESAQRLKDEADDRVMSVSKIVQIAVDRLFAEWDR